MTIEQAIEKAIEGGYNGYLKPFCMECGGYESPNKCSSMFLDPLFWKSLGKAMGWSGYRYEPQRTEWEYQWHRFIDHLASQKYAESFFESL